MALIVCKECGRKISDTSEKCIHCGAWVTKSKLDFNQNEIVKATDYINDSQNIREENNEFFEKEKEREFGSLAQSEKYLLEDEFQKNDKWARKYFRCKSEFVKFRRPFCWFMIFVIVLVNILMLFVREKLLLLEYIIVSPSLLTVSLVSFIALFAVCFIMFLYGVIGAIYFSVTHKKYVYSKRFMIWLSKEKNIKYTPPFVFEREREIFDSIYIEDVEK